MIQPRVWNGLSAVEKEHGVEISASVAQRSREMKRTERSGKPIPSSKAAEWVESRAARY